MTSYEVIKNFPKELISLLDEHESNHSEKYYYDLRKLDISKMTDIDLAARFIYLNKDGYNGMYELTLVKNFLLIY